MVGFQECPRTSVGVEVELHDLVEVLVLEFVQRGILLDEGVHPDSAVGGSLGRVVVALRMKFLGGL